MSSKKRWLVEGLLGGALVLCLAACSGNAGAADGAENDGDATQETAPAEIAKRPAHRPAQRWHRVPRPWRRIGSGHAGLPVSPPASLH